MDPNKKDNCRFGAPFLPSRNTITLIPIKDTDSDYSAEKFKEYKRHYILLRKNLENYDYDDFDHFYTDNNIDSDEHYYNIIRAGIVRPKLLYRRSPSEKWHNAFNPFVFHCLQSNMDFQIIQDEYACASYVVEYVNKHNRGISNLQRLIIQTMDENPDFDMVDITKKLSIDVLHAVEMPAQEAAWYLLREPMAQASVVTAYIPTIYPIERQRIRKTLKELNELDDDCTNIWKENWFDKYERRPETLENITLAQFVANYDLKGKEEYRERRIPRIIRYRNYDMAQNFNDYRREMVLLHVPFRSEDNDILAENKFIPIYEANVELIIERRREFESNLDMEKTLRICKELGRNDDNDDDELRNEANVLFEADPYEELSRNPDSTVNADIQNATLSKLGAIAKKRENLMDTEQFYNLMRSTNSQQNELLLHIISHLQSSNPVPFQIFFTGPAGSGKTFVIKLIMEIYNRFTDNDGYCNSFIACASTGKAAVAIDGTTVHTALKISISRLLPLSSEILHLYRSLFRFVRVLIIDEISMISAELLAKIDFRLKQITGAHNADFGGIDVILIGDLRQAPPVRATLIYKPIKTRMIGPHLWRGLKFYQLTQVMRQANAIFSTILTKIGNGDVLEQFELELIESRFFKKEETQQLSPHGIRLFQTNHAVNSYNNAILQNAPDKIISIAYDVITGSKNAEQEASYRLQLHKKSVIDTGGLPYQITLVKGKYYLITTNIDVIDGLVNGAVGKLLHLDLNEDNVVCRVWMEFCGSPKIGQKARRKAASLAVRSKVGNLAVPIELRTSNVTLTRDKKVVVKRRHFPLISACAMTIHKSQGGTFEEIVYEYDKKHPQQLVYVALSRVRSIEGLFIVTPADDETKFRFHHNRKQATSTVSLLQEFKRLSLNQLQTKARTIIDFMSSNKGVSLYTFNVQSLRKHSNDLNDSVTQKSNILLLSETWLDNEERCDVPNFNCITQFKRDSVRSGGVAIYQNKNDTVNILTPNMEVIMDNIRNLHVRCSNVADMCAVECILDNGSPLIMAVIYVSPNKKILDIQEFIHRALLEYSKDVSNSLSMYNKNFYEYPLILAGDFNINFSDEKSKPLVKFLSNEFGLNMNNDPAIPTTKFHATIDAVFSRHLDKIQSQTYVSYFSYHKPIITKIECTNQLTD